MKKLLFVYNVNSGVLNSWMGIARKIKNPSAYSCELYALTHGSFREKRTWKNFHKEFEYPLEFYHKDEFLQKFKSKWLPAYEFPIILISDGVSINPLITLKEIVEVKKIEELIESVKTLTQQDFD